LLRGRARIASPSDALALGKRRNVGARLRAGSRSVTLASSIGRRPSSLQLELARLALCKVWGARESTHNFATR
jgi:hypothetical protein